MELHAHPIEWAWLCAALAAVGGTLHAIYLAIEDRTYARVAVNLRYAGAPSQLRMADINLWSELFRFTLASLSCVSSGISVLSPPAVMADFAFFPQTMTNIVVGITASITIILWAIFDIIIRRDVAKASM